MLDHVADRHGICLTVTVARDGIAASGRVYPDVRPEHSRADQHRSNFRDGNASSELPKNRGLIRSTRSGPTSIRVGKRRLPRVQRLAWKTLLDVDVRGAVDMPIFYRGRLH